MAKLTFYRQKRFDGAIRTGVELDGETIAERYEGGHSDSDPRLLWYVDLRCEGPSIPDDLDAASHWLLENAGVIREGFRRYADQLKVGADPDLFSLTWSDFSDVPVNTKLTIACSATRRTDARELGSTLAEIGENWEAIIRSLDIPQEVEDLR